MIFASTPTLKHASETLDNGICNRLLMGSLWLKGIKNGHAEIWNFSLSVQQLNRRREIPYLQATMCINLFIMQNFINKRRSILLVSCNSFMVLNSVSDMSEADQRSQTHNMCLRSLILHSLFEILTVMCRSPIFMLLCIFFKHQLFLA